MVGGGTAGCVLASRLSEDSSTSVLLLEAGSDPVDSSIVSTPRTYYSVFTDPDYDWGFVTEPQGLPWQQGKMLGGSGSHNGMVYTRGSRFDYDRWAQLGNKGWSYDDVLPYFKKSENMDFESQHSNILQTKFHGIKGEMFTKISHTTPYTDQVVKAAMERGFKHIDYNGIKLEDTVSPAQVNVDRKGLRSSTLEAFLRPVMSRRNLDVVTEAFVTKIDIKKTKKGHQAKGVFFLKDGTEHYVKANKEVIISGGSINSPKLLMLSGIGPMEHLGELGIDTVADLPVGDNLNTHFSVALLLLLNQPSPIVMENIFTFEALFEYVFSGKGPWSSPQDTVLLHQRIKDQPPEDLFPYIENIFWGPFLAVHTQPDLLKAIKDGSGIPLQLLQDLAASFSITANGPFLASPTHLHPNTRGTVRLRSKDPHEKPKITYNYLDNDEDIRDLITGIQTVRAIANTTAFKTAGLELLLSHDSNCQNYTFDTEEYWQCYVRFNSFTQAHITSTCKMANDSSGVVDDQLRVKGVSGLRVVDASIMPFVTSGHTHAPTIMIAEKAYDIIKQKH